MSFYGYSFVFDGISSEDFGLMLYDVGELNDEDTVLSTVSDILEDRISGKWKPYFYGAEFTDKLSFPITFGVNEDRLLNREEMSRHEIKRVADWLTCHKSYKYLEIRQPDMEGHRYKCMINGLSVINYGSSMWAFRANVVCDSPYAYELPYDEIVNVNGSTKRVIVNESSISGRYYPMIEIGLKSGGDFSIINNTDNGRKFEVKSVPAAVKKIFIDGENGIVTCDQGINMYNYINFDFIGFLHGDNDLTINGNGYVRFTFELPINIGG